MSEHLSAQVDRLANFIMENIPGEPAQSQGAIDTAIRLLGMYQAEVGMLFAGVKNAYKSCLPPAGDNDDTPEKWQSRRDNIRFRLGRLMEEKVPLSAAYAQRVKLLEGIVLAEFNSREDMERYLALFNRKKQEEKEMPRIKREEP